MKPRKLDLQEPDIRLGQVYTHDEFGKPGSARYRITKIEGYIFHWENHEGGKGSRHVTDCRSSIFCKGFLLEDPEGELIAQKAKEAAEADQRAANLASHTFDRYVNAITWFGGHKIVKPMCTRCCATTASDLEKPCARNFMPDDVRRVVSEQGRLLARFEVKVKPIIPPFGPRPTAFDSAALMGGAWNLDSAHRRDGKFFKGRR